MKVLSTKTLDEETIAYARSLNIALHCVDFIDVSKVEFSIPAFPQQLDAVAFTSANAVKYFFDDSSAFAFLRNKKVFSLSGKTAIALSRLGVVPVMQAESAGSLADKIIQGYSNQSVLHVCGLQRLNVLERKLKDAGINYTPLVVYKTSLRKDIQMNEPFDAVMFFSPSGVEGFFKANDLGAETICCCIGQTTAVELQHKKAGIKIIVSPEPGPVAMIDCIAAHFKNKREN